MEAHTLDYIKKEVLYSPNAALLIGPNATTELGKLYETLTTVTPKGLIEIVKDEATFWNQFLGDLRGSPSNLEGYDAFCAAKAILTRSGRYHLFLPDVDKMFYRYDIQQKGRMAACLRAAWMDPRTELTILASVKNVKSREYKRTIDKYVYPLWMNNWLPIRL